MDKNTQLIKIHDDLNNLLTKKSDALPKDFNKTRFIQNAITVLQDTKNIEKMNSKSVARTLLKGAFLGLDFFNKECYAIPYGNGLQFQTDYKGEIKLAKKYSIRPIADIYAKLVRVGDKFQEVIYHGKPSINFEPLPFNNNEVIGAFAVCIYKDGNMIYETMSKDEIEQVRITYSKQPDGKAWKHSWGEMAKKTVIRRLTKLIELDFDSIEARKAWEDGQEVEFNNNEEEPIKMPTMISQDAPEKIEEPPKKEKPKESAEVKDRKMEIITKIRDAIMEHTGNNFAESQKELERFTQFVGDDGQVIPGVKSTELMKGWTFKRVQVTWGKIKKEYGIE